MKTHLPLHSLFALLLACTSLAACLGATPVFPVEVVELTRAAAGPTHTPQPTPEPTPGPACMADSDCVLAYRTDHCCPCPAIYNREQVESNRRLRYYDEPEGYRYRKWRCPRRLCLMMMCAPCPQSPFGLLCDAGACRAAETWQEIWNACAGKEPDQLLWCHANAAIAAYQEAGEGQAADVCNSLEGEIAPGVPNAQECLLYVARSLMTSDPQAAAGFCRARMDALRSACLNETAFSIGRADVDAALVLCGEIDPLSDYDRQQKDFCYHNLAMSVAKVDLERAREICEFMSTDVEQCKQDALNPQGVP